MCFSVCVPDICVSCMCVCVYHVCLCKHAQSLSRHVQVKWQPQLSVLAVHLEIWCPVLPLPSLYLDLQPQVELLGSEMLATTMGFFDMVSGDANSDLTLMQQTRCSLGHFLNLCVHHGFSYFSPTLLQSVSCLIFKVRSTASGNILVISVSDMVK